jgi:Fe-Mn family superoxide dismutase
MKIKEINEYFYHPRTVGKPGYGPAHPLHPDNVKSLKDKFKDWWNKQQNKEQNKKPIQTESKKEKKLELVKLSYKLDELSPVLSKENVEYHYNVLSAGYVNRYNNNEGDTDFNYGGATLHNLFWSQLQKPKSSNNPTGEIKNFIEKHFKTFNEFQENLLSAAMTIQGSGWVYLAKNGSIKITPNQSYKSDILMPIDMWEHSFTDYIPAKDAKKKYIKNIIKIINWEVINHRLSTLNEDAAGVGIITKQNTTGDVKPGDEYKNVKKLHLEWQEFKENFADKKVRGKSRPGRVKRAGASCKGSVSSLRSKAKRYSGERGKMYHWCANMKSGRSKK